MIELRTLKLLYDQNVVLKDLSVTIDKGEILGVIGSSGIGKTSLLKLMAGFLDSTSGEVFIDAKLIIGPSEKLIPGYEEIQLVNQDFKLDVYQTVRENIQGKILHLGKSDRDNLVDEMLDLVELTLLEGQKAHELSGGEQQRVALARALVCEPAYLLLDEPFVHLDQRLRYKIINYLLQLNEIRETTIIIVSHDGSELMGFAKRLIHLADAGVFRDDVPLDFFYNPSDKDQAELLGSVNEVTIDGNLILFRPNEYSFEGALNQVEVVFVRSIDTGVTVLNYFRTANNENVMLSATRTMNDINSFYINKR